MSYDPDNVTIGITTVTSGTEEAQQKMENLKDSVESVSEPVEKQTGTWKEHISRVKEAGEEYQVASSPLRSISWDLLLTGRSLSMMNQGLFGSNQQFKQMISLIYSVASVLRLVVMAYDAQRLSAERAAAAGYMSTHDIPKVDPFAVGARLTEKQLANMAGKGGTSGIWSGQQVAYTQPTIKSGNQNPYNLDIQFTTNPYSNQRDYLTQGKPQNFGVTPNPNNFAMQSALSAAKAGIVQSTSQNYLPQRVVEDKDKGMNFGGIAGGVAGLGLSAIPAIGPIIGPLIGSLIGAGVSQGLSQYAQGGVIPKDMPLYAHKGEALVREKDFYAVNQILSNFNKPMKTDISQNRQPSVALPKSSSTVNNSGDVRNFTNINMTTGPIGSNVDVKNMLKQMAQAQTTESRRRTGQ